MKRLLTALCLVALAFPLQAREGFGFSKKAVTLMRTVPPSTNVGARRVRVTVDADRSGDRDDARTLERYVGEHILSGAGTLADTGKPEVTVMIALDRLESHETWETKTEYVRQQTGTKQEWNESKKKYESKPVYSNVPVQKSYKVLTASLTGAFDVSGKAGTASGTLEHSFRETYGDYDSAPAPTSVEDDLLKRAAKQIAATIVPTQERISVLVPRASFEALIPYAESGQWEQYLQAVEAIPPRKNAKEEAYRQHAMAIAKEALAYQAEDRAKSLELLRAAKAHYDTAVATNPGEELFNKGYSSLLASSAIGSPTARISDSVNRYTAWTGAAPSASPVRVASTAPQVASSGGAAPRQAMGNQTVIDLAKAGLSDENIILAIDGAERTAFDVSPDALITLSKSGVSKAVIAHMQKKSKR